MMSEFIWYSMSEFIFVNVEHLKFNGVFLLFPCNFFCSVKFHFIFLALSAFCPSNVLMIMPGILLMTCCILFACFL